MKIGERFEWLLWSHMTHDIQGVKVDLIFFPSGGWWVIEEVVRINTKKVFFKYMFILVTLSIQFSCFSYLHQSLGGIPSPGRGIVGKNRSTLSSANHYLTLFTTVRNA